MGSYLIEHRIRVRNRADNADLLVVNSVRADASAYLKEPPSGDGQGFNPRTNQALSASYTGRIVDAITSGTTRVVTSVLEDVNNHLQLGYLKAYIESRRDSGAWGIVYFGNLTAFRLVSDVEWEFQIQDPSIMYDGFELFNATSSTTISSFLASWPNRGCLLGGPIMGSWLTAPDHGGWTMKVHRLPVGPYLRYWLEPIRVFAPFAWAPGGPEQLTAESITAIRDAAHGLPHGVFSFNTVALSTIADAYSRDLWWTGLIYLIDGVPFRPIPASLAGHAINQDPDSLYATTTKGVATRPGLFAWDDGQNLSEGAVVRVRALTVLPSEASPILVDRHPVDHLTDNWTIGGIAYNSAACTALKQLMGTGLRHAMILTGARKMGDHLREAALQFGIATRINASGELVPFSTRIFSNVVPTKTITDALVVQGTTKAFEVDVGEGLQRVTLKKKTFTPLQGPSVFGVLEGDVELTLNNGAANALASGSLELVTSGMFRADPFVYAPVDLRWLATFAEPLFDRFGEGNPRFSTDLIRGDGTSDADTANLGDEVLVNVKQIPNHNKRYGDDNTVGARALQIIQVTERVDRRTVVLSDSGPNAQALATAPTHTIAASTDLPRTVAEVTITNAAALNALAYAVVLQLAVTTGAAPATTDYVDFYRSAASAIPTGALRLPAVTAGRKVYLRGRSEKFGSRPSDWSTGVSVTLTAIAAVTGLTATAVAADGSYEDLAWTVGVTDCGLDIYVRASGAAFSTAIKQAELLPGSTRYRLVGLTPNTAYTASVQHRDQTTQDVSALTEATFTTANATYVLLPPIFPDGFSFPMHIPGRTQGRDVVDHAQRYGIVVVAQEYPGTVEVAESVEDSVGAGTYGAYALAGRVPAVSGDYTLWTQLAPNDGLRRKLKARSVSSGQTSSAYSDEVVVNPATIDQIETFPLSITNFREKTRATTTITTQWENKGTAVEIWLWYVVSTQPVASDPWPDLSTAPTIRLTAATTEYTFDIPDQNTILHGVIVPIGAGAVAGVPWRFTLQPSTATRLQQRATIAGVVNDSPVVRVEVANPIPGADVSIAYVSVNCTVSPASPQTVAAANVPTDLTNSGGLTNYVDFTVTRSAAGASSRVIFTASSTDRIADVDAVDVEGLGDVGNASLAISSAAACTLAVDGPAWVASYKWAESTSAFPSDATVRASGTTTNGRQIAVTLAATPAVGTSVYVTLLPYAQSGASGVEGASIRIKATRHDFTATKTIRFVPAGISPTDALNVAQFINTTGYARGYEGGRYTEGLLKLQVAPGVTITAIDVELFTGPKVLALDILATFTLYRISATGGRTSIGSVTSTSHNGWETKTFTCSEDTTGQQYQIYLLADNGLDGTVASQGRCAAYYVTHTMPSSTAAL